MCAADEPEQQIHSAHSVTFDYLDEFIMSTNVCLQCRALSLKFYSIMLAGATPCRSRHLQLSSAQNTVLSLAFIITVTCVSTYASTVAMDSCIPA